MRDLIFRLVIGLVYGAVCYMLKVSAMKQFTCLAILTGLALVAILACLLVHFARAHETMGKGD